MVRLWVVMAESETSDGFPTISKPQCGAVRTWLSFVQGNATRKHWNKIVMRQESKDDGEHADGIH